MDLPLVLLSTKCLCNLHCTLMATENSTFGIGVGVNHKSCKRRSLWPPTKKGPLHPLNPTSHNMHYKKPPPPPRILKHSFCPTLEAMHVTRHPTPFLSLTTPTNLDVWLRLSPESSFYIVQRLSSLWLPTGAGLHIPSFPVLAGGEAITRIS